MSRHLNKNLIDGRYDKPKWYNLICRADVFTKIPSQLFWPCDQISRYPVWWDNLINSELHKRTQTSMTVDKTRTIGLTLTLASTGKKLYLI